MQRQTQPTVRVLLYIATLGGRMTSRLMKALDVGFANASGASVTVYLTGTTTLASLFVDRAGTMTATNPVTADANGQAHVYAPDGRYDLKVTAGTITFTVVDWEHVSARDAAVILTPEDYGAAGDGTTDDTTALTNAAAAAAALSPGGTVQFSPGKTYLITGNLTIAANVGLSFAAGSRLSINTGVTVIILGPVRADLHQIFSGAGTVRFNLVPTDEQWALAKTNWVFPEWWGINGSVAPFDTAAVQAAINTHRPVKFNENYYVTTITMTGNRLFLDGGGFRLIGVATTAQNAVLQVNLTYSVIRDLTVDANYNTLYGAAIYMFSTLTRPTGFCMFYDLSMENTIVGLAYGAFPGGPPGANAPQSENVWFGGHSRGTQNPIYMNQPNGRLCLVGFDCIAAKNEWDVVNPGVFNYANAYCFNQATQGGALIFMGGSIENQGAPVTGADGTGNFFIGSFFKIVGATMECQQPILLTSGQAEIGSNEDGGGFPGRGMIVQSGATGRLLLHDVAFSRSSGLHTDGKSFVDGSAAPNYVVEITNSVITEWAWDYSSNDNAAPVLGCVARIKNSHITNVDVLGNPVSDIYVDNVPQENPLARLVDVTGQTLGAQGNGNRGGWVWAGAGSGTYGGESTDLPAGYVSAIEMVAGAGAANFAQINSPTGTAGIPVLGGTTRILAGWVKTNGAAGAQFAAFASFYRADGSAAAVQRFINWSNLATFGPTTWTRLYAPVTVPADAQFVELSVTAVSGAGAGVDMKLTGLQFL